MVPTYGTHILKLTMAHLTCKHDLLVSNDPYKLHMLTWHEGYGTNCVNITNNVHGIISRVDCDEVLSPGYGRPEGVVCE